MAFTLCQLNDEPIIIFTVDLPVEAHQGSFQSIFAHITQLMEQASGPLFFILDGQMLEPCLSDILLMQDALTPPLVRALRQPNIHLLLAGTHPLLGVAAKKLQGNLAIDIPWFASTQAATDYAHSELGFYV